MLQRLKSFSSTGIALLTVSLAGLLLAALPDQARASAGQVLPLHSWDPPGITAASDRTSFGQPHWRSTAALTLALLGGGLVAAGGAARSRAQQRRALLQVLAELQQGNLAARADEPESGEFAGIAKALNRLADSLAQDLNSLERQARTGVRSPAAAMILGRQLGPQIDLLHQQGRTAISSTHQLCADSHKLEVCAASLSKATATQAKAATKAKELGQQLKGLLHDQAQQRMLAGTCRQNPASSGQPLAATAQTGQPLAEATGLIAKLAEQIFQCALSTGVEAARAGAAGKSLAINTRLLCRLTEELQEAAGACQKLSRPPGADRTPPRPTDTAPAPSLKDWLENQRLADQGLLEIVNELSATLLTMEAATRHASGISSKTEQLSEALQQETARLQQHTAGMTPAPRPAPADEVAAPTGFAEMIPPLDITRLRRDLPSQVRKSGPGREDPAAVEPAQGVIELAAWRSRQGEER